MIKPKIDLFKLFNPYIHEKWLLKECTVLGNHLEVFLCITCFLFPILKIRYTRLANDYCNKISYHTVCILTIIILVLFVTKLCLCLSASSYAWLSSRRFIFKCPNKSFPFIFPYLHLTFPSFYSPCFFILFMFTTIKYSYKLNVDTLNCSVRM